MQSDKQKAARERNWQIFRIRGLESSIKSLRLPTDIEANMLEGINKALSHLGAETAQQKQDRWLKEFNPNNYQHVYPKELLYVSKEEAEKFIKKNFKPNTGTNTQC